MTILELTLRSSDLEPARRFEVFTRSGRRRKWLPEETVRVVAESTNADETVSAVARWSCPYLTGQSAIEFVPG